MTSAVTMDPTVFPAEGADDRLKRLWYLHGHPHSKRFSNPALTTIPAVIKHNVATQPSQVAFIYPTAKELQAITWAELWQRIEAATASYYPSLAGLIQEANNAGIQPTIALLGTGNTFEYFVTQMSLLNLGVRILLLSDKNAPAATLHLVQLCKALAVLADSKNQALFPRAPDKDIPIIPMIDLDQLNALKPDGHYERFESKDEWKEQALIIHSSGSTGLPKPIIHTNRSLLMIARMYRLLPEFAVENWYLCFPLYHIAGVSIILSGIPTGLPTTFPPRTWPPSPSAILSAWKEATKLGYPPDCLHCAPSVIEDLYEYIMSTPEQDFSPLIDLKILQPGGAALSPNLLKKLVELGVNVKTTYGTTETGPPFRTIPHTRDNPRCYHVRNLYPDDPLVQMEPVGEGLFECVVYKGFPLAAELWLAPDAPNPYRTNDLFIEDPPGSGFFVLQGRKDDLLIHSNGEKTNATAVQMELEECSNVIFKSAVFGNGKPCVSVVIELAPCDDFIAAEKEARRAIAGLNASLAAHSRIMDDMVLVLGVGESLPVTPKGNVRRKEAWKLFGDKIEALYQRLEEVSEDSLPEASDISDLDFVRSCVSEVCMCPMDGSDATSFYDLGLDSQKAIMLRSKLLRRYGKLPLMFIYEHPSVLELTKRLTQASTKPISHAEKVKNIVQKYSAEIRSWSIPVQEHKTTTPPVVYLTGATGALGNALLEQLLSDSKVQKIYCAVRGKDPKAKLVQSLESRGYDKSIWDSPRLVAVNYDMRDGRLGLDEETFQSLKDQVTLIIHGAWKMDFNQRVEAFENDCIQGVLNLMKLASSGQPKVFAFTSSVAAAMGPAFKGKTVPEDRLVDDSDSALDTGYAQSKFIVEMLTQTYHDHLHLPVRLLRVGQLCGHSRLGYWNSTEMFPIMIATGIQYLSAMPTFSSRPVNWLAVDICAETTKASLISSERMSEPTYTVQNLVHPAAISWERFLDVLEAASETNFARVSMKEWVDKLQEYAESHQGVDIPGMKLVGFFEDMAKEEGEEPAFATSVTNDVKALEVDLVKGYIARWKQEGFWKTI